MLPPRLSLWLAVVCLTAGFAFAAPPAVPGCPVNLVCVTTYGYQPQRTSQNLSEPVLVKSALTGTSTMGLLFTTQLDEAVYAQPLYLPNVVINNATHNVLYVATENNTVYAMDADASQTPLWSRHLDHTGTGALGRPVTENVDLSSSCTNFLPNYKVGITGTPVIDLSQNVPGVNNTVTTGVLYVIAKFAIDGPPTTFAQTIYALDVTTGSIIAQMDITGTITGHPTSLTFAPKWLNQRAALLLQGGQVYAAWGSHCDSGSWSGWLMSFQLSGNSFGKGPTAVWNSERESVGNTRHAGIWGGGSGIAGDGTYVYATTGNGAFNIKPTPDANSSYLPCTPSSTSYVYCDYGESLIKLSNSGTAFTVQDFFTPGDQANRTNNDYDLGSSGPMIINPGGNPKNLAVQSGKEGDIYLLNLDGTLQMGGYSGDAGSFNAATCSMSTADPLPDFDAVFAVYGRATRGCGVCPSYVDANECGPWTSPAWWGAGSATPAVSYVYLTPANGKVRQYKLCPGNNASLGCPNQATLTAGASTSKSFNYPVTTPVVTSASSTSNAAVLWFVDNATYGGKPPGNAVLYAYDATSMNGIWNSKSVTGGIGAVKFVPPVIANGKVYVAGYPGVAVYGLK